MTKPLIFLDPHPRNEMMVYDQATEDTLNQMGRVVAHFGSRAPDDLVDDILSEVEIIIGQTAMPKERLERAPRLRGIHVLSAAPCMAPPVAEYCVGQAIMLARGLHTSDGLFRDGSEAYGIAGNDTAYSLYGADVALLGYGNLGRALAPLLQPFGCRIMVHDPWLSDSYLRNEGLEPVSLEHLLTRPRFIFLLAGVTSENEGFLNRSKLEAIRPDSSVILASRAEIVSFPDFVELAGEGQFRAAVDVFPQEPVAPDDPVRMTPKVLYSAHLAGGIRPSYARIREAMLDDVDQILKGLPPLRMQRAEPSLASKMRSR